MERSENSQMLSDDPFVVPVYEIEAMQKRSEHDAVKPPTEREIADLMMDLLSHKKA